MDGVLDAARALWTGSLGSWYALTSATLVRAIPLTLAGLAVAISFRAGVVNIGAEGQLVVGAAAATAVALATAPLGPAGLALALAAGAGAGAAWAWPADLLRRRAGVLEVISTLLLNAVALALVGWLVRGPLQEPLGIYPQSDTLSTSVRLPPLWRGTRLHAGLALAAAAAAGLAWWARRTAGGFRARAVGANPAAAASAGGIAVDAVRTRVFLAAGALAGLAGAVEVTGVTFALYENLSPGYGYTAIAVALLAGLDPRWVAASALLFAALQSGALAMQRDAGVPSTLVQVVEAVLILGVVAWGARRPREAAA